MAQQDTLRAVVAVVAVVPEEIMLQEHLEPQTPVAVVVEAIQQVETVEAVLLLLVTQKVHTLEYHI